jgi:histone-lysine N-methyltransferase SETD3
MFDGIHACISCRQVANLAGRDGGSGWGLKAESDASPGTKLLELPTACHLTYSASDSEKLLRLIDQVPSELWGAKLALQVGSMYTA